MMNSLLRGLSGMTCALAFLGLVSCSSSSGVNVQVSPGAAFKNYEIVWFRIEDGWSANHSIVEILQQEFERRYYAVKMGEPPAHLQARSMVLFLQYAGDTKVANQGRIDHLGHLTFSLLDSSTARQLATVTYAGGDRDRVEQKELAREIVDKLLGPRT